MRQELGFVPGFGYTHCVLLALLSVTGEQGLTVLEACVSPAHCFPHRFYYNWNVKGIVYWHLYNFLLDLLIFYHIFLSFSPSFSLSKYYVFSLLRLPPLFKYYVLSNTQSIFGFPNDPPNDPYRIQDPVNHAFIAFSCAISLVSFHLE